MTGINCEVIKLLCAMSISGKGPTLLWYFTHFLPVFLPSCTNLPIQIITGLPYFTTYPPYLPPHYLQGVLFCFGIWKNRQTYPPELCLERNRIRMRSSLLLVWVDMLFIDCGVYTYVIKCTLA